MAFQKGQQKSLKRGNKASSKTPEKNSKQKQAQKQPKQVQEKQIEQVETIQEQPEKISTKQQIQKLKQQKKNLKDQSYSVNQEKEDIENEEKENNLQQEEKSSGLSNLQSGNHQYYDSSDDTDDEIITARIGKVPWKWYENYKHFGYDAELKKIQKSGQGDKIDEFLKKAEDPNWWKTIRDEINQEDVQLTDEQLFVIKRIMAGKYASKAIQDADYNVEFEYNDPMPLDGRMQPKRRFQPSKWERMMVNKIVAGIQRGTIVLNKEEEEEEEEELFDLWGANQQDEISNKLQSVSAPKMKLPTNAESYNPPEEYLLSKKEQKEWENADPEDRENNFLPKKYECLRHVEFYDKLINERFERCLDLYLCPRTKKKKLDIDPESLIPKIPKPEELRPYPTTLQIQYLGHKSRVRGISCLNNGQYLASIDEKGEVIVWEVQTSRIVWRYQVEQIGYGVQFTCDGLLCVAANTNLYIFNIKRILNKQQYNKNEETLAQSKSSNTIEYNQKFKYEYSLPDNQEEQNKKDNGLRVKIFMNDQLKSLSVHKKGDYVCTVAPNAEKKNEAVIVHCISKGLSSQPFNKTKGIVEKVIFHHQKPIIFILTRKHCFVYNLQKQANIKKLMTGAQYNSSIDLHPYGDNLIIGSYDKKVLWFDLDLQSTPYKSLRYHERAVRNVKFHQKYPLMATCSDDGQINILHAKVHQDMMENALILPVKMLKGHTVRQDLGVLDIQFHPIQPWIFSAGADHRIFLWT